jgi:hypothetical protein
VPPGLYGIDMRNNVITIIHPLLFTFTGHSADARLLATQNSGTPLMPHPTGRLVAVSVMAAWGHNLAPSRAAAVCHV